MRWFFHYVTRGSRVREKPREPHVSRSNQSLLGPISPWRHSTPSDVTESVKNPASHRPPALISPSSAPSPHDVTRVTEFVKKTREPRTSRLHQSTLGPFHGVTRGYRVREKPASRTPPALISPSSAPSPHDVTRVTEFVKKTREPRTSRLHQSTLGPFHGVTRGYRVREKPASRTPPALISPSSAPSPHDVTRVKRVREKNPRAAHLPLTPVHTRPIPWRHSGLESPWKTREKLGAPRLKQTRVPNISPLTRGKK